MSIQISSNFDSGNIEVLDATNPANIRLRIRRDAGSEFMQWFHFRVQGARGQALRMVIENAGECSYADGWHGYRCAAVFRWAENVRTRQLHRAIAHARNRQIAKLKNAGPRNVSH